MLQPSGVVAFQVAPRLSRDLHEDPCTTRPLAIVNLRTMRVRLSMFALHCPMTGADEIQGIELDTLKCLAQRLEQSSPFLWKVSTSASLCSSLANLLP